MNLSESTLAEAKAGEHSAVRPCPFCTEPVPQEIALCSTCGRFSKPGNGPAVADRASILEKLKTAVESWEAGHPTLQRVREFGASEPRPLSNKMTYAILSICVVLAGLNAILWLSYGAGGLLRGAVEGLLTAGALYWRDRITMPGSNFLPEDDLTLSSSVEFLGMPINLPVVQLASIVVMIICAITKSGELPFVISSLTALSLIPLLYRTQFAGYSVTLGLVALGILEFREVLHYWFVVGLYPTGLPLASLVLAPCIWLVALIAAVPQLQLLKLGPFRVGRLRGDTCIYIFGSKVPLAFTSSLLLTCVWGVFASLWYLPAWF